MEHNTPEPTPIYWDGESNIVTRWHDDGLPDMLYPADAKTYPPAPPSHHDRFRAEDLDRKCSEAEYRNGWYGNA